MSEKRVPVRSLRKGDKFTYRNREYELRRKTRSGFVMAMGPNGITAFDNEDGVWPVQPAKRVRKVATRKSNERKPVLKPDTLYVTDDRLVCSNVHCCGMSALYTGKTIHGVKVLEVPDELVPQFAYKGVAQCQCGAITKTVKRVRKSSEPKPPQRKVYASRKPKVTSVKVTRRPDGCYDVFPHFSGVTRSEGAGYMVADLPMAKRLSAALMDPKCVSDVKVLTDNKGETFVSYSFPVRGRAMNADLRRLGH